MTKKTRVLIRSEHTSTVEKKPETYGLSKENYLKFCHDLESCRNDKGQWDYLKVIAFARKLLDHKEIPSILPFNQYETPMSEAEAQKMVKEYFEDHDPLELNPWVIKDDDKERGKD